MGISLSGSWIFLVLLWRMVVTEQTQVEKSLYRIVKPGQNITGKISAEIKTKTELQCSLSCTVNEECTAYRLSTTEEKNCGLINENSNQTIFVSLPESHLYEIDECYSAPCQNGGTCIGGKIMFTCECSGNFRGRLCEMDCNHDWGCPPVVQRSLDSEENLQLMNGAQIVLGRIGNAVKTNRNHNQYVDLGDLSEACITVPETCGPEGAAISFWFKLDSCGGTGGLISTESSTATGFIVACNSFLLSFHLILRDEVRSEDGTVDIFFSQWYHFACSITDIGNEDEKRFKLFYDGTHYNTNNAITPGQHSSGSGRVLIGRAYSNADSYFTSVELDELLFFNRAMTEQEIQALYQQHV